MTLVFVNEMEKRMTKRRPVHVRLCIDAVRTVSTLIIISLWSFIFLSPSIHLDNLFMHCCFAREFPLSFSHGHLPMAKSTSYSLSSIEETCIEQRLSCVVHLSRQNMRMAVCIVERSLTIVEHI